MTMDMGMSIIDAMKAGGWGEHAGVPGDECPGPRECRQIVADRFNTHVFNGL